MHQSPCYVFFKCAFIECNLLLKKESLVVKKRSKFCHLKKIRGSCFLSHIYKSFITTHPLSLFFFPFISFLNKFLMMNNQSLLSCELDQQEQDIAIVKKRDFSLVTSYTDEETYKKRAKSKTNAFPIILI